MKVILFTDGASQGNPGPAGAGYVMSDADGHELSRGSRHLGQATNNVAEYQGVRLGLLAAKEAGASDVLVRMDSELVVRQLTGRYQVKNADLRVLYDDVLRQIRGFRAVRFEHVPRERNRKADAIASAACSQTDPGSPVPDRRREAERQGAASGDGAIELGRVECDGSESVSVRLLRTKGELYLTMQAISRQTGRIIGRIDLQADRLGELLDVLELGWTHIHAEPNDVRRHDLS